ncbi:tetratricopeptide repeat protein [Microvirga flavescens]|uniref:tetratricopeptide repeat protein n=1 Tax=Microvirga flavescens TaxID=2249811 RepID=UPI001FE175C8|nr:tetratricopeptide repeat protein [Microvirga flavescens]
MRIGRFGLVPALLLASTLAATAAPTPDDAYAAYQAGLYLRAMREATARLDKNRNDAPAMTLIGELFNQGLGVPMNPVKAAEWYKLAAKQGDPNALSTLGLMALEGRGMEKNPVQGKAWLEEAAAKGEPRASYNLGLLYMSTGDNADLKRAVGFLKTASGAEIGDAQHALGVLYLTGKGVEKSSAEAARLFERAARNGSLAGEVEYAILLFNGDGVKANETEAATHFRRAAARGNAIAQNRLARMLVAGRGVQANRIDAAAWHLLAASQGLTDSWLDGALKDLSPEDRAKAAKLAAERSSLF